jgi:hypothetical protein
MAARQWTLEQRKQQAMKIKQWQPWLSSTGAKTAEGKAKASRNAFKGGLMKEIKRLGLLIREFKKNLNELHQ